MARAGGADRHLVAPRLLLTEPTESSVTQPLAAVLIEASNVARRASCTGSSLAGQFASGPGRCGSSDSSHHDFRLRSMSRQTRATTLVGYPSRFSTPLVSARLKAQPRLVDGVVRLTHGAEHAVGYRSHVGPM